MNIVQLEKFQIFLFGLLLFFGIILGSTPILAAPAWLDNIQEEARQDETVDNWVEDMETAWEDNNDKLDDLSLLLNDAAELNGIVHLLLNPNWDNLNALIGEALGIEAFDPSLPQVVGVPPDTDSEPQAYLGPHPSRLGRPAETFDFPIGLGELGPLEPLFAGPLQYPFLCGSEAAQLGQPVIDNQEGLGIPVYIEDEQGHKTETIAGYSQECQLPTQAVYYYNRQGTRTFWPLKQAHNDIAQIRYKDQLIDFIVRVEVGTINRFIYLLAALKGPEEATLAQPDNRNWNKRLIYKFRGGVGIGHRQGDLSIPALLTDMYDQLQRRYAFVYSSANQTSVHYNIWLAEDSALRVKQQFIALYGQPFYTIGIGGSGGAIQQYLIGQNNPRLLDAIMPLYSYPDMVTQTIHALDCEPLEYYFDVIAADWSQRRWIEGSNARDDFDNETTRAFALVRLLSGYQPLWPGSSECAQSWRGLAALGHNPNFVHFYQRFTPEIAQQVHWSHWEDLKQIYGVNEWGYARNPWDNVGVQYGLQAVIQGRITPEEFLDLNARIGGWKQPHEMTQERYWFLSEHQQPKISLWSHHNMNHSADATTPAPRTQGDPLAIEAAYRSGHVFIGRIDIPILDMRHYLEAELDMHHAAASFSARQRIIEARGHADNQLIWVSQKPHTPLNEAFKVLDDWLANIDRHPEAGVAANKPSAAVDQCFNSHGEVIAAGEHVWDGTWNHSPSGECMQVYPIFSTSRGVAGDDISGDTFKCQLISIEAAVAQGIYGTTDMAIIRPYLPRLKAIFPQGVCDYSQPPVGKPADL
ncbi:MAG: DUF6351 family protein [Pseudomonadota bacterium]|nr:DUF6351 family protein [Pseudomonadota bacterium]